MKKTLEEKLKMCFKTCGRKKIAFSYMWITWIQK